MAFVPSTMVIECGSTVVRGSEARTLFVPSFIYLKISVFRSRSLSSSDKLSVSSVDSR